MARKNKCGSASVGTLTNLHTRDRWFTAAKVLLAIAPFISLAYLQAAAGGSGLQLAEILAQNPQLTVSFLASMSGPFVAYLLIFAQKHLYSGDADGAVLNLTLMMISEAILRNTFYFIMMIVLLYFVFDLTGANPVAAVRRKWKDHFWRDASGGITVMVFSAFCLFVSMRLGMV